MTSVYTATDTLVGPIVEALATIIETQITPTPLKVYRQEPDSATLHNTVTIPLAQFKQTEIYDGRINLHLVFSVTHWFRREKYGDAVAKAWSYIPAYLQAFNSWHNQPLGGLARTIQAVNGGVKSLSYSGNIYVGLTCNVDVYVDFFIDATP